MKLVLSLFLASAFLALTACGTSQVKDDRTLEVAGAQGRYTVAVDRASQGDGSGTIFSFGGDRRPLKVVPAEAVRRGTNSF